MLSNNTIGMPTAKGNHPVWSTPLNRFIVCDIASADPQQLRRSGSRPETSTLFVDIVFDIVVCKYGTRFSELRSKESRIVFAGSDSSLRYSTLLTKGAFVISNVYSLVFSRACTLFQQLLTRLITTLQFVFLDGFRHVCW